MGNNNIHKENNFSRLRVNNEKCGAYYTDKKQCNKIANLFHFEDGKEYAIIEPSIGNAEAVLEVTKACTNKKIFGVELNKEAFESLSESGKVDYLINADFLNGVTISNNIFSFCFMNPPYGEDFRGERLETQFVVKVTSYIRTNGVLCMVVPEYVFTEDKFLRTYLARYEHLAHYRFDDEVYAQFKQVVVVGKRKSGIGLQREVLEALRADLEANGFPYLPTEPLEAPIFVPPSSAEKVEMFSTLKFDAAAAFEKMQHVSPLYSAVRIGAKTAQKEYGAVEFGEPILPPSPSMCYLMATVGGGAGLCGNGESGSLHLQRGNAQVVKEQKEVVSATGVVQIVETTKTVMSLKVLEQSGKITSF